MTPAVARWTPIVQAELAAQAVPLPKELILEVIRVESNGKAGVVNPKSGASGLMQVMPITLEDYNRRHGTAYTLLDMRREDKASARKQIRVGLSTLAHYWRRAYNYLTKRLGTVPVDELARIADLYYAAGPAATRKRLDPLPAPTWTAVQSAYPGWAALSHPRKVLAKPKPWHLAAIGSWLESGADKIVTDPKIGFALGILLMMAIYWWIRPGKESHD